MRYGIYAICEEHTGTSDEEHTGNVVPTKSDSDVILCLQLLSKTLTCALHFSYM